VLFITTLNYIYVIFAKSYIQKSFTYGMTLILPVNVAFIGKISKTTPKQYLKSNY